MEKNIPKISIIIPIFNVEPYLKDCLESVKNQDFKDFEAILVNDGSTDNSLEICEEYAKKDSRFRIINKENGGLSDARNIGIKAANASIVGFLDSDDLIDKRMYSTLLELMEKNEAQISVCGLYDVFKDFKRAQCSKSFKIVLSGEEALKEALIGKKFSVNAVNKLYMKNIFKENLFPINKLSEDAFTIPWILKKAQKVAVDTTPLYFYMHRGQSITSSGFKEKDLDVICAYAQNLEKIKKNHPNLKPEALFRFIWAHIYVLDKMMITLDFSDIPNYKKIRKVINKNLYKLLISPYFSSKRKALMFIFLIFPGIYKKIIKSNFRKLF